MLKNLGHGNFGNVMLVQHRITRELYALKMLAKERVRGSKHALHFKNEKSVLSSLNQSLSYPSVRGAKNSHFEVPTFFVKYYDSFQDESKLYLLCEYLPGGELLK